MQDIVDKVAQQLVTAKMKLVTAESCTGGQLASQLTQKSGASQYFERGFITYSNEAKAELLNVHPSIIEENGAVSEQTAIAMAKGALKNSKADISISITGIAGPEGGSADKPVGTVYFGYAVKNNISGCMHYVFDGERQTIQNLATKHALFIIIDQLNGKNK
ncbi:MAG: CinA family protein [Bdellovibrionales bacterium]